MVRVDVLGQKFGCASGDDDAGDAEVVAPHVAVFEAVALHAEIERVVVQCACGGRRW